MLLRLERAGPLENTGEYKSFREVPRINSCKGDCIFDFDNFTCVDRSMTYCNIMKLIDLEIYLTNFA